MRKDKQHIRRRFTGKLSGFQSKAERNFAKKALKAYIKGKQRFQYGWDIKGNPRYVPVPQEYYRV